MEIKLPEFPDEDVLDRLFPMPYYLSHKKEIQFRRDRKAAFLHLHNIPNKRIAEVLKIQQATVSNSLYRMGCRNSVSKKFANGIGKPRTNYDKYERIASMRNAGKTLAYIAECFGCSRQNIHSIIQTYEQNNDVRIDRCELMGCSNFVGTDTQGRCAKHYIQCETNKIHFP